MFSLTYGRAECLPLSILFLQDTAGLFITYYPLKRHEGALVREEVEEDGIRAALEKHGLPENNFVRWEE